MINPEHYFKSNSLKQIEEHIFELETTIPNDLPYFDGHFENNPIFPAVGIIDFSILAISSAIKIKCLLKSVKSAKFKKPVTPGMDIKMSLQKLEDNCFRVKWLENETAIADLRLVINS